MLCSHKNKNKIGVHCALHGGQAAVYKTLSSISRYAASTWPKKHFLVPDRIHPRFHRYILSNSMVKQTTLKKIYISELQCQCQHYELIWQ